MDVEGAEVVEGAGLSCGRCGDGGSVGGLVGGWGGGGGGGSGGKMGGRA